MEILCGFPIGMNFCSSIDTLEKEVKKHQNINY